MHEESSGLEKINYDPLGPAEPELALVQSDIAGIDRLAGG